MVGAMTRGLNIKSLTVTVGVVFVYVFISDFLIHGVILKGEYQASASMWRPETQMQAYFPWMILGQILVAKFFVLLFAKGYEGHGVEEGFRFGLLIGFFQAGFFFIQYAVSPLSATLLWSWVGLGIAQAVLGGVVASLVYKK